MMLVKESWIKMVFFSICVGFQWVSATFLILSLIKTRIQKLKSKKTTGRNRQAHGAILHPINNNNKHHDIAMKAQMRGFTQSDSAQNFKDFI